MKKRMRFTLLLLLIGAMAFATACSGTAGTSSGAGSAQPPADSTPSDAGQDAGTADKEPVTLKISTWNPISKQVVEKFQEKYPYITLEHDYIADQYREIIRTRIVSKADMDIVWMFPNQLREFADQDVLMDMTGEPWLDSYLDSATQLATVDNKTYGFSYNYYAVVFFYNKDIFKKYNLSEPKNWEELLAVAETLKANGVAPIITGGKDAWATQFVTSSNYGRYQTQDPAVFDKLASGEKKWTDPEFAAFFDPLIELVDKGYFLENSVGLGNDQVVQVFKEGKAAMYPMGTWALEDFPAEFDGFEVGAFAVPVNQGSEPLVVNLVSDNIFTGISWSKHQEEIKLFLAFISEPENALLWSEETKSAVTVKGGTSPNYHPIAGELTKSIEANVSAIFPSLTPSMEPTYFPLLQKILLKQNPPPAEMMAEMQQTQEKDYK